MAIPGFQDIMLPLLNLASDGEEHRLRDTVSLLSIDLGLSENEQSELLPSGQQTIMHNRVAWARTYLVKAGLLTSTRRGYVRISSSGRELLDTEPQAIDVSFLKRKYSSIRDFLSPSASAVEVTDTSGSDNHGGDDQTPEEILEVAYQKLREELADDLLLQVKDMTPAAFEKLVVELLVNMGYGGTLKDAGSAVGQSGDGGIDGIIKEDRLGLDAIYIQAKRYTDQAIGRPAIQGFVGALQGVRARKGVFIISSRFASPAIEYVKMLDIKVVLIDGKALAEYMIDFDLGVTKAKRFEIKRLDSDYFEQF